MRSHTSLEQSLLNVFREAYRARRFDVAEHLLCALEVLDGQVKLGAALREAYLTCNTDDGTEPNLRPSAPDKN